MAAAQQGDKVTIHFIGSLEDGTIFDSTHESAECDDEACDTDDCDSEDCGCGCDETGPMELVIGGGEFFPQIEEALVGMSVGDKKTVQVPAVEAFGEYDTEKVFTVPRSDLPADMEPEVGNEYILTNDDDEDFGVTVTEVTEEDVTFDSNHPLAGEDLSFEVELVSIG
jgi:peptidylprolyl isomerase